MISGERPDPTKIFVTPSIQQINNLCHSPYPTSPCVSASSSNTSHQSTQDQQQHQQQQQAQQQLVFHDQLNTPTDSSATATITSQDTTAPATAAPTFSLQAPLMHTSSNTTPECSHDQQPQPEIHAPKAAHRMPGAAGRKPEHRGGTTGAGGGGGGLFTKFHHMSRLSPLTPK